MATGTLPCLQVIHIKQLLANFSSGLDAVVFINLLWYSSCRLGTVSLTINLSVLQPKNPQKALVPPGVLPRREVGDPACTFPWGPKTDHPCSLPASPDASDAGDARLVENIQPLSQSCSNDFWARRSIGCLAPPLSCLSNLSVLFPWLSAAVPPRRRSYAALE